MEDNTLTVYVEVAALYGKKVVYPIGHNAKTFAAIAKGKTLTEETVDGIKALGYKIKVIPPKLPF